MNLAPEPTVVDLVAQPVVPTSGEFEPAADADVARRFSDLTEAAERLEPAAPNVVVASVPHTEHASFPSGEVTDAPEANPAAEPEVGGHLAGLAEEAAPVADAEVIAPGQAPDGADVRTTGAAGGHPTIETGDGRAALDETDGSSADAGLTSDGVAETGDTTPANDNGTAPDETAQTGSPATEGGHRVEPAEEPMAGAAFGATSEVEPVSPAPRRPQTLDEWLSGPVEVKPTRDREDLLTASTGEQPAVPVSGGAPGFRPRSLGDLPNVPVSAGAPAYRPQTPPSVPRIDDETTPGRRPETLDDRLRGVARPATLADHVPEHGRGRRPSNGGPSWSAGSGEHPYDRQARRPASLADHPGPARPAAADDPDSGSTQSPS
ncbi:hypothetical protein [Actinoplanes sp. NPDC049802]|uniref:hypothetical protein n=1 Tax=Actinoplanes sp. NPDC049802 TaxID=3154742 RepID=UPI0033E9A0C3